MLCSFSSPISASTVKPSNRGFHRHFSSPTCRDGNLLDCRGMWLTCSQSITPYHGFKSRQFCCLQCFKSVTKSAVLIIFGISSFSQSCLPGWIQHSPLFESIQPLHKHFGLWQQDPPVSAIQRNSSKPFGRPQDSDQTWKYLLPPCSGYVDSAYSQGIPLHILPSYSPSHGHQRPGLGNDTQD